MCFNHSARSTQLTVTADAAAGSCRNQTPAHVPSKSAYLFTNPKEKLLFYSPPDIKKPKSIPPSYLVQPQLNRITTPLISSRAQALITGAHPRPHRSPSRCDFHGDPSRACRTAHQHTSAGSECRKTRAKKAVTKIFYSSSYLTNLNTSWLLVRTRDCRRARRA